MRNNNKKIYPSSLLASMVILALCVQILFVVIIYYFNFSLSILASAFLSILLMIAIFYPFLYYLIFEILVKRIRESKISEKEKEKLALIVENAKEIIFMFEPKSGKIFYLNKAGERIIGEENKNIFNIISSKSEDSFREGISQAMGGYPWEKDIFILDLKGNETLVSQTLGFYKNDKEYVFGIAKDVRSDRAFLDQIEGQLKELEKLNEIMVGRELKMSEMKKEIKELKERAKEKEL